MPGRINSTFFGVAPETYFGQMWILTDISFRALREDGQGFFKISRSSLTSWSYFLEFADLFTLRSHVASSRKRMEGILLVLLLPFVKNIFVDIEVMGMFLILSCPLWQ